MNTVIAPSEFHLDCCLSVWYNLNRVSSVDFLFEYNLTIYRVSQKKVMPFVIQICRELLVVEI